MNHVNECNNETMEMDHEVKQYDGNIESRTKPL